jgi:transcriptional regulator with XRE-family HTH domain
MDRGGEATVGSGKAHVRAEVVSDDRLKVGGRIRQARDDASMSRLELARKVGVTRRTVEMWEGNSHDPRGAGIGRIAAATGKPLSFFFEGSE